MNYIKIQKKILDEFLKNQRLVLQTLDEHYLITAYGTHLFRIPKTEMWLDIKKMMEGRTEFNSLHGIMMIEGEDGVLTGEMKQLPDRTTIKVKSENNYTWIDKKIIEKFEIKKGLHFTISDDKRKPVLVWENNELCGLICPIRVKEDE